MFSVFIQHMCSMLLPSTKKCDSAIVVSKHTDKIDERAVRN